MPKWTVLLPTHDRADVLPYAIASVLGQAESDFELLVVGDGCTDNTADVVRAAMADGRVRWFDLPKEKGFGVANRNRVLREAKGDFVAYMTHDDLWMEHHLETLASSLTAGADLAYSRPLWVEPDGSVLPTSFNLMDGQLLDDFLAGRAQSIPACCVAHRRVCFDRVGYWDPDLPHSADADLWRRIIRDGGGQKFAYHPNPTALHFRARWRGPDDMPNELFVWREMHRLGLMHHGMVVGCGLGATEQERVWRAIAADPVGFAAELTFAVWAAIDRFVYDAERVFLQVMRRGGQLPVIR